MTYTPGLHLTYQFTLSYRSDHELLKKTPLRATQGSSLGHRPGAMKDHQPRSPRFDLHLPIRFFSTDGLATGHCVNVSETGMRVTFERPIDFWLEGELDFVLDDLRFNIKARVVRVDIREAGMLFHIDTDADKLTVEKLLELAAHHK